MKSFLGLRNLLSAAVVVAAMAAAEVANAQTPHALPTAPGADKAERGHATSARASLPGDNGSPVEPYLFLFILAGGGIIAGVAVNVTDRHVRSAYRPSGSRT